MRTQKALDLKTILAAIWLIFTLSLVTWWWIFVLTKVIEVHNSTYNMILFEGSTLIFSVLLGGIFLVVFTYRDFKRHQRLNLFFANFSHDIKTSIARLRLQAEVLNEDGASEKNPVLHRLISDIARLELQLENSLLFSSLQDSSLHPEKILISEILKNLRNDFSELQLELNQDIEIFGDKRALLSIFRNILNNSILHGHAETVTIQTQDNFQKIRVVIADNGKGYSGSTNKLGTEFLKNTNMNSNGLGLHLCKKLISKMNSTMNFQSSSGQGFTVILEFPKDLV